MDLITLTVLLALAHEPSTALEGVIASLSAPESSSGSSVEEPEGPCALGHPCVRQYSLPRNPKRIRSRFQEGFTFKAMKRHGGRFRRLQDTGGTRRHRREIGPPGGTGSALHQDGSGFDRRTPYLSRVTISAPTRPCFHRALVCIGEAPARYRRERTIAHVWTEKADIPSIRQGGRFMTRHQVEVEHGPIHRYRESWLPSGRGERTNLSEYLGTQRWYQGPLHGTTEK